MLRFDDEVARRVTVVIAMGRVGDIEAQREAQTVYPTGDDGKGNMRVAERSFNDVTNSSLSLHHNIKIPRTDSLA